MTDREALDRIFSKYIRLKHSDSNGNCRCYTCGMVLPWQEIQNGHFIPRSNTGTRWEEDNCRPQCKVCNEYKHGNLVEYRKRLVRELGEERVCELERAKWQVTKMTSYEIQELIKVYQLKVKELLERRIAI